MQTLIAKEQHDWVNLAWTWIHDQVQPGQRVFVPAGGTPIPLYRRFVAEPSSLLSSLTFVQIDDILTGPQRGIFRKFFEQQLAPFYKQIEWIDFAGKSSDVAILGVGVNGHVAFHEPGLAQDFYSGCVPLTEETRRYLNLSQTTWGVTYGVGAFLKAKAILVLARGESKQHILRKALKDRNLPISWILEHPNVTLVTDFDLKRS